MGSLLDWGRKKLSAAPEGSCAFWIDVRQVLAGENGLADADDQLLRDDRSREWKVVRYRANPFSARRALADASVRTVVWCVGAPGEQLSDLTPFEDHIGRAHHIDEISLRSLARESAPGMELPAQLDVAVRTLVTDADTYISALSRTYGHSPVTLTAALNVLVTELTGAAGGIDVSSSSRALASTAVAMSAAPDAQALSAIHIALQAAAEANPMLAGFLSALSGAEPTEIVATVHLGSALARLEMVNIGALLVAESVCPHQVFREFGGEPASAQWTSLASNLSRDDLARIASAYESGGSALRLERLCRMISSSQHVLDRAILEPVAEVRLAALISAFEQFVESEHSASGAPSLPSKWDDELERMDALAAPLRMVARAPFGAPAPSSSLDRCARDFVGSPVSLLELALAEAKSAFGHLERLLTSDTAESVRQRLAGAQLSGAAEVDAWDKAWSAAIAEDVSAYLSAPHQTWRRSRFFTEKHKGQRWLLVFDGLRYDLWRRVLLPALNDAGFAVDGEDMAFCFLPSITEISRRTLIGGVPSIGGSSEAVLAERLATQFGLRHSYQIKAEVFRLERDAAEDTNVRVFSWPDKQVHGDVMDMGTLVSQFRAWVSEHLMPWVKTNLGHADRIAVSSDHGFVGLLPEDAVDITQGSGQERNLPRVVFGKIPPVGVPVVEFEHDGQSFTLAASRRWFRKPGGRAWQFAHGGCTLAETLVPFAELVPTAPKQVEVSFEGLPQALTVAEGESANLEFRVTVRGGTDRAPTVEVVGYGPRTQLQLAIPATVRVPIQGEEGLTTILVRVRAGGRVVEERALPVVVKIPKVGRTQLDLDL